MIQIGSNIVKYSYAKTNCYNPTGYFLYFGSFGFVNVLDCTKGGGFLHYVINLYKKTI